MINAEHTKKELICSIDDENYVYIRVFCVARNLNFDSNWVLVDAIIKKTKEEKKNERSVIQGAILIMLYHVEIIDIMAVVSWCY